MYTTLTESFDRENFTSDIIQSMRELGLIPKAVETEEGDVITADKGVAENQTTGVRIYVRICNHRHTNCPFAANI